MTAQCFDPSEIPGYLADNFNDFYPSIKAKSIDEIADTILENLMLFHLSNLIAAFNHPRLSIFFKRAMKECADYIERAMCAYPNSWKVNSGSLFWKDNYSNPSPDSVVLRQTSSF